MLDSSLIPSYTMLRHAWCQAIADFAPLHRDQVSSAKPAAFGDSGVFRSGAPRSMKMGTTSSPWRYDAAADQALQSANLRGLAISHYASSAAAFPISQGDPVTLR